MEVLLFETEGLCCVACLDTICINTDFQTTSLSRITLFIYLILSLFSLLLKGYSLSLAAQVLMSYGTVNSPDEEEGAGLLGGDADYGTPSKEVSLNRSNRQKSSSYRLVLGVFLVLLGTCAALWLTAGTPAPEKLEVGVDWVEPTPSGHKIPLPPEVVQSLGTGVLSQGTGEAVVFPTAVPTLMPTDCD